MFRSDISKVSITSLIQNLIHIQHLRLNIELSPNSAMYTPKHSRDRGSGKDLPAAQRRCNLAISLFKQIHVNAEGKARLKELELRFVAVEAVNGLRPAVYWSVKVRKLADEKDNFREEWYFVDAQSLEWSWGFSLFGKAM
jgi:hypothetical protein